MFFIKSKAKRPEAADRKRSEEALFRFAQCSPDILREELGTSASGLSPAEAELRHEQDGPNIITTDRENSVLHRFFSAVVNPFNIVLLIIAAITFITDVLLSHRPDYTTVSIIVGLVAISGLVAFIQGERSNSAAQKLSKMISNRVDVLRDGRRTEIMLEEVVRGDIVLLSAGDMLPGDIRFLETKDAFVAQAALTGESNPVEKFSALKSGPGAALTELSNIGFMGSNMVSGSAVAAVLEIGNSTYFGSMARSLSGNRAKNRFERGVDSVSRLLIRLMLVVLPAVFVINGITKGDWAGSLLFAISIAVGLTPEMLPVIMTTTLATGAIRMARHRVIVKTLSAIQTFGEMDVLCTDKTGTLTEDRIVLEKYMNSHGEDDIRVLRHAFLNSSFQTGLKNLIDIAIINRAGENELSPLLSAYTRVDEIPFDFSRRRMSVVLQDKTGKRQLITKGAVEEMLSVCSFAEYNGRVVPLDDESRHIALETYEKYNSDGLRMLAVAQKNEVPDTDVFGVEHEKDLVLIGFVGFLDPPKESAKAAIEALSAHGVRTVVLTGDSAGVAAMVCSKVGIDPSGGLWGRDVSAMSDAQLREAVKTCFLFSKLSPYEKQRVVAAFQENGHTVGYMGDGINDAPAMRQSDIGISVDSAVDIAKETADIILLEKDLLVLEEGAIEGRRTFGNIIKYIKTAVSGNFSNIVSVIAASIFLPFLPMLPVQILAQNLLYDFSQMGIPFDNVDAGYIKKPRKWDPRSISRFMFTMGPISSLFDILCFAVLWHALGANKIEHAPLFQSGWFIYGAVSQIMIIHIIRTPKLPFAESNASRALYFSTAAVIAVAAVIAFSTLAVGLDMLPLPISYLPWLAALLVGYALASQLFKFAYLRRYGQWL